jgi:hypothetical protein
MQTYTHDIANHIIEETARLQSVAVELSFEQRNILALLLVMRGVYSDPTKIFNIFYKA